MTKLEEEIKKRFTDEQNTVGIDNEGLWEDIAQELDRTDGAEGAGYRYAGLSWMLLVALLGSVGYALYFNDSLNAFEAIVAEDFSDKSIVRNNIEINKITKETQARSDNTAVLVDNPHVKLSSNEIESLPKVGMIKGEERNRNLNERIENEIEDSSSQIGNQSLSQIDHQMGDADWTDKVSKVAQTNSEYLSSRNFSEDKRVPAVVNKGNGALHGKVKPIEQEKPNTKNHLFQKVFRKTPGPEEMELGIDVTGTFEDNFDASNSFVSQGNNPPILLSDNTIKSIRIKTINSHVRVKEIMDAKRKISKEPFFSKKKGLPMEILVSSGLNYVFNNYSNEGTVQTAQEYQNAYKGLLGISHSVRLIYNFENSLSIGSGLDFDVINSQFDYVDERSINLLLGHQLVGYEIDPITLDTVNQVYQEIEGNAIETRTVRHGNKLKVISIPLQLVKNYSAKNYSFGVGFGLRYNIVQSQSGKLFNSEGEIALFNGINSDDKPYADLFISYNVQSYLERRLNDKLGVRLSPSFEFQTHGVSDFSGLRQNVILIKLQLGILYSF